MSNTNNNENTVKITYNKESGPFYEKEKEVQISKKESNFSNLMTTLISVFLILVSFYLGMVANQKSVNNEFADFKEVKNYISEHYNLSKLDESKAMKNAIAAYVYSTNDPYSFYLSKEEYNKLLAREQGSYVGIGLVYTTDKNGNTTITDLSPNGPAATSGIKIGDTLVQINNIVVKEYTGDDLFASLNLKEGDKVKITILRNNEKINFELIAKNTTQTLCSFTKKDDIAYIKLKTFSEASSSQLASALKQINADKNYKGIILDLRGNGGGTLNSLTTIASNFLDNKKIATFDYKTIPDDVVMSSRTPYYTDLPLVVLADKETASASECLIGALKYYKRATVVGTKTYGKGIGQSTFTCSNGNVLKFTTSKYYLPDGESIHEKGIEPDYEVLLPEAITNGEALINDENDTQLQKAIEILKKS